MNSFCYTLGKGGCKWEVGRSEPTSVIMDVGGGGLWEGEREGDGGNKGAVCLSFP